MNQNIKLPPPTVRFVELVEQQKRLRAGIERGIAEVLEACHFTQGPQIERLETELAAFCGARHVVTCASGTDALRLVLMAKGVGPGCAVLCPSFTFAATAEVIALLGATPIFVDALPDTFNLDPDGLEAGFAAARAHGLPVVGIIAVDLFGQPADHDRIQDIASAKGVWLLSDAAQSFGASYKGSHVGGYGEVAATSFYPTKPLGCYGDGGAIFTNDTALESVLRSLRVHGQGEDRYDNVRIGITGRLDTIQAAVLLEKLKIFRDELDMREAVASRYSEELDDIVSIPTIERDARSSWAQYTIKLPPGLRDGVANALKSDGVPTAVYYGRPLHLQTAYRAFPRAAGGLPVSETLAAEVLSLPIHPYLSHSAQDRVISSLTRALRR